MSSVCLAYVQDFWILLRIIFLTNKVVLKRPCCVCLVVQVKSQNIAFLATRIGRFSISLDNAWFLDNTVCVVAYKMTSTNTSGLFGRVGEFNVERETFSVYVERMEMFFTANNIVETTGEGSAAANQLVANRKRAIFLTEVGPEVYSTLSNLLAPAKPKDTLFTDIVRILEKHYNPKPLEIAQSFHFGTRNQKSEESVSDYVLALKKLAVHCRGGRNRKGRREKWPK